MPETKAPSSDPTVHTEPSKKGFSFGLLQSAARGKFSTRKPLGTGEVKTSTPQEVKSATVGSTNVSYRSSTPAPATPKPDDPVANVALAQEKTEQSALEPDRIAMNPNNFFSSLSGRKELLITASAAKSLTRLFSALTLEPGSGREIPAEIRRQVLDMLVRESHTLADKIGRIVAGEGRGVPIYLRAKLLQQSVEFISEQWIEHARIDTDALLQMARMAFDANVPSLSQEIVDLFHIAGEYTPADDQQISQARISEAAIRASWSMLRQVNHFDLNDYDPQAPKDSTAMPFSYGLDPHAVAADLTRIALSITQENKLEIDHLDLATTWTQNSIDRAATLVRQEYRLLTDRALRSTFREELFSEAALQEVNAMYPMILEKVHERARNSFILVEKNAIDAMAANAYTHYVPKAKNQESKAKQLKPIAETESGNKRTFSFKQ